MKEDAGAGMADETLDATGLLCPLPVLRARKRLLSMAPGAVLAVETSDPAAVVDMPHFCGQAGHELLSGVETAAGMLWHIRRGPEVSGT